MQYITTTNLRTQTSKLVKTLKSNSKVSLIHRSQVIGVIEPVEDKPKPIMDITAFEKLLDAIKPKKLILKSQREKIYRRHLEEKYGKSLS